MAVNRVSRRPLPIDGADASRLADARRIRNQRVVLLSAQRITGLVSWLWVTGSIGRHLPDVGRWMLSALPPELPVIGTVATLPPFVFGAIAAGVVGVVVFVTYLIGYVAWSLAIADDDQRLLTRKNQVEVKGSPFVVFVGLLLGVGLGFAVCVIQEITHDWRITFAYLLGTTGFWVLTALIPAHQAQEAEPGISGPEAAAAEAPAAS
jgi:hypothetical protein